jgi:hypothetical protein
LLIELARVTNLKPRIEAKSTSNVNYQVSKPELDSKVLVEPSTAQTLRRQGSSTNTNHLESLNLNETRIDRESNTLEENYQVSKPELDSKVLVDLSTEQQLRLQNSSTNTNYLGSLNLNKTHIYQEPNTPEENHLVPKPELNFKALVEQMAAAALPRTSDTPTTKESSYSNSTTPLSQTNNEESCQPCQPPPTFTPTIQKSTTPTIHKAVDYNHNWYQRHHSQGFCWSGTEIQLRQL